MLFRALAYEGSGAMSMLFLRLLVMMLWLRALTRGESNCVWACCASHTRKT